MGTRAVSIGVAVWLAVAAVPGLAAWGWLNDSAVAEFTEADWDIFQTTALKALDEGAEGDPRHWRNPDTGTHGSVVVVDTFQYDGRLCRKIAFRTETGSGTRGQSAYSLCQRDGSWAFVTESELSGG
jgi:surface antigen